ncbi:MAG: hypothetical protein WCD53_26340 [Microcoleus sp.]
MVEGVSAIAPLTVPDGSTVFNFFNGETPMATQDKCCSIVPYFKIASGKTEEFKEICDRFIEQTKTEPKCLYYGFSFYEDIAHCREGYEDAEGVLIHLENVGIILEEALKISELIQLEIHGCEAEISKLRSPLASLNPKFFGLEYGFRNHKNCE